MKFQLRVLFLLVAVLVACATITLIIKTNIATQVELSSECSEKATRAGMNQKVVSYSFYRGNMENDTKFKARYVPGVQGNYQMIQKVYPGWMMRVYTDISEESELVHRFSNEPNFYICNVAKLPGVGNVTHIHKMVWRFLALGDPTVSTVIFRDLDSLPGDRERAAVAEWEISDKIFHAMRDCRCQKTEILGGLWGVKSHLLNATVRNDIRAQFIKEGLMYGGGYGIDQFILKRVLYDGGYKKFFMVHDSYHCGYFNDSVPFPTERKNRSDLMGNHAFGSRRRKAAKCPVLCRPSYGKNWTYC